MLINYLQKLILKKSIVIEKAGLKVFNKFNFNFFFANSMAEILQKIAEDFKEEFLFELGYDAGDDTKEEMFEKMRTHLNSSAKNLRIIKTMCEVLGFGSFKLKKIAPHKGKILIHIYHNPVIDESIKLYGKKSKVSSMYRGIYSVHAEKQVKVNKCRLIETKSITKGDEYNEWSCGYFN